VFIDERPEVVDSRERAGDWEGDTMVGEGQQGYLATFVEHRSRLTIIQKMDSKKAETLNDAALEGFHNVPPELIHTLTLDNGTEFAWFKELEQAFKAEVYFCHPYSSWEKGSLENMNGLIRQYVPKGTNILQLAEVILISAPRPLHAARGL
jgi:IS30 family transposase